MRKKYVRKEAYDMLPEGKRKRLFHRGKELDRSIQALIKWELAEIEKEIPKEWEGGITFDLPRGEPFTRFRNGDVFVRRLRTSELYNVGVGIWPIQSWHDGRGDLRQAILDALRIQAEDLLKMAERLRLQWEGGAA